MLLTQAGAVAKQSEPLCSCPAVMTVPDDNLTASLSQTAERVERTLDALLSPRPEAGEIARPERLVHAMRHGVLNGGKRFRPALAVESARLFGLAPDDGGLLRTAAAIECIHCYSLIHDDLPAMDDDDLRRGQPTVHVLYDEATAILAGDALMTLAFAALADERTHRDPATRARLVLRLALASGTGGMAGGQMLDLEFEDGAPDEAASQTMQAMKTGALIEAACGMGAIHAGASADEEAALSRYGLAVGLAFQLADDLLDHTSSADAMGKAVGKDSARGKATFVTFHGIEGTQERLRLELDKAHAALDGFGERGATLKALARFVAERTS